MHPRYHRVGDRRTRLRWAAAALAGYALLEVAMEAWQWMKPDRVARGRW